MRTTTIAAVLALFAISCKKENNTTGVTTMEDAPVTNSIALPVTFNYAFEKNTEGWQVGYSDYPANLSLNDSLVTYAMLYGHRALPANILPAQSGVMIRGRNVPDDLFMFMKKKITGLKSNTSYSIAFDVDLASNAPTNAVGVGGAPGEDVTLKAGAKEFEPQNKVTDGFYRINIDKGQQSIGGTDMKVLGHIGVANNTTAYTLINRNNYGNQLVKTTNANGELWVIVGTDSGFEGLTQLYYAHIRVVMQQL